MVTSKFSLSHGKSLRDEDYRIEYSTTHWKLKDNVFCLLDPEGEEVFQPRT